MLDITRQLAIEIDNAARAKGLTIKAERVKKTSRSTIWVFGLLRDGVVISTAFSRVGLAQAIEEA
jgi:hypothetical protein